MAVNYTPASNILAVEGIRLSSGAAGVRYKDREDLLVVEIAEGSSVAGVFTQNRFCAAPVLLCREFMADNAPRYLVINSGNANAGTGQAGLDNAREICEELASLTGVAPEQVLPFSTGVIGELLPVEPFRAAFPEVLNGLDAGNWSSAANAIMTTDTLPKAFSKQLDIGGNTVTITGIAKGAGMIEPNMATMLAYVATDAQIEPELLQSMLKQAADLSFNSITVDGDTSTNDALMLMATGKSQAVVDTTNATVFQEALDEVCRYLAQAIIRDAEGATKFVTLTVDTAPDLETARAVAYTVARSPLVKTALFASDPNWGRLLAAIGRSPVKELDISKLSLSLGETALIKDGEPVATYTEAKGQQEMDKAEITISIGLHAGDASTTVWTSDLSHDYVTINAEYRS
ncbi:bifunctional glutamate N-acetyltransferase/amino-acid acetyltransferase ArgJ [Leucothrix pacifica]|uniref:Arginine biosynthesis bifunctional protein ArgJ n=1 Tax=Leucothrix pacifica TaxID=1247513 RepID=A0A317CMU9_9GAMM|nr:bifunctional glutamate N-acetyltransferase/amino-acid acetyltransferase ArgJ [Leucothrix pacifica]PWQ99965.1 bifunctional ornithine acetyltransferase/N-acetylglutamate synthase [Leucothrix pacifica]